MRQGKTEEKRDVFTSEKQLYAHGELHKGVFFSRSGFGGASEICRKVPVSPGKPLTERYFPSYNWEHEREQRSPLRGCRAFFVRKFAALKR